MANKTMHHVVIGENTYEIVDQYAREHGGATIDSSLSATSTNPVQNKAIYAAAENLKEQIYNSYPTGTAGPASVAVIDDGADDIPVKSLEVGIEPVQSLNGYDKPWAGGAGKNLLAPTAPAGTVNGITYTVNSDGSIKASGTATAQAVRNFYNNVTPASVGLADGKYIISGCPSGGSNDKYALRVVTTKSSGNTTVSDYGNGATFTIDSSVTAIRVYLYVGSGQTVNNIVFKPMIRKSSETDATYEPYSNVCPISGWDAVKVARTGKNLLPNNYTETVFSRNGITFTVSDDGVVTANGTATTGTNFNFSSWEYDTLPFMHRPGLRLRLSGSYPGVITRIQTRPYGSSTNTTIAADAGTGAEFTVPDDVRAYALFINITSGQTVTNATFYPVISVADEGQPTWSPSEAEVEDITLPSTVYGGTLDVTKGILTVDRAMVDLGTLNNWTKINTQGSHWRFYARYNDAKSNGVLMSSQYVQITPNEQYAGAEGVATQLSGGYTLLMVSDERYADVASFKTAMSGVQLVYELATPITYTLTPTEIKTLLGENRIYADAGDATVEYRVDFNEAGLMHIPKAPTADGSYRLTADVSGGTPTYRWEAAE